MHRGALLHIGAALALGVVSESSADLGLKYASPAYDAPGGAGIAIVDLDNDGDLDSATAGRPGSAITILLNDGTGQFAAPLTATAIESMRGLEAGDVDGDGDADLVVIGDADDVAVLLNNGDATFQTPALFTVGVDLRDLTLGDLDGDGDLDLALADYDGVNSSVWVLLNEGSGSFGNAAAYDAGDNVYSVANGDLDGDGDNDLGVTLAAGHDECLVVLLNGGGGLFGAATPYAVGNDLNDIAIVDADGDGDLDVIVADQWEYSEVDIVLNVGDGTFDTVRRRSVGGDVNGITVADLDLDGLPDVVATVDYEETVILKNGGGILYTTDAWRYPLVGSAFAVGDIDLDGYPDVALGLSGSTTFLLSKGHGNFHTPLFTDLPEGGAADGQAVGDFNADGVLDIAVTQGATGSGNLYVYLGDGDGSFGEPLRCDTTTRPFGLVTADFNGDGIDDLAVNDRSRIGVHLSNGDGTFAPLAEYVAGTDCYGLGCGDFDGDEDVDLVVVAYGSGAIHFLVNDGAGDFTAGQVLSAGYRARGPAVADMDADGDLDVVWGDWYGGVKIAVNDGGVFAYGDSVTLSEGRMWRVAAGDVNGDGYNDVVISNGDPNEGPAFWVIHNQGDGTLGTPQEYGGLDGSYGVVVDDLDGDGDDDVVVAEGGTNALSLYENLGAGVLATPRLHAVGTTADHLTIADLDDNGNPDFMISNRYQGQVGFGLLFELHHEPCIADLTGDDQTDQGDLGLLLASYLVDAGGDLDGDGDTDQADLGILLADYGCGVQP